MKKLKLAVLPGDGIGRDVTFAVLPVFEVLDIPVEIELGDIGWECWKKEGEPVPQRTWEIIKNADATLLGATTSKPEKEAQQALPDALKQLNINYVSPIVQLRQKLDLYANIRPCFSVKDEENPFHFVVIRENTEGLYAGFDYYPLTDTLKSILNQDSRWENISNDDVACSLRVQSREGLRRLFKFAFNYADKKRFQRVTFADKPNVLRKSSAFAREIFEEIAKEYPHIKADIHNVDAVALWLVRRPQEFGVVVAENMFGDILSDLGAAVMGGLGFAASANIGKCGCYFEPVHGSAPRIKTNRANPSAMFLTVALLLEHFGYHSKSNRIKFALKKVIKEGCFLTYDLGGEAGTIEMAQAVITYCEFPQDLEL